MNPLQLQQSVQRVTPAVRDTDTYFIGVLSRHVTLCALLGVTFVTTCHACHAAEARKGADDDDMANPRRVSRAGRRLA
jgi:hypothetical protein